MGVDTRMTRNLWPSDVTRGSSRQYSETLPSSGVEHFNMHGAEACCVLPSNSASGPRARLANRKLNFCFQEARAAREQRAANTSLPRGCCCVVSRSLPAANGCHLHARDSIGSSSFYSQKLCLLSQSCKSVAELFCPPSFAMFQRNTRRLQYTQALLFFNHPPLSIINDTFYMILYFIKNISIFITYYMFLSIYRYRGRQMLFLPSLFFVICIVLSTLAPKFLRDQ